MLPELSRGNLQRRTGVRDSLRLSLGFQGEEGLAAVEMKQHSTCSDRSKSPLKAVAAVGIKCC